MLLLQGGTYCIKHMLFTASVFSYMRIFIYNSFFASRHKERASANLALFTQWGALWGRGVGLAIIQTHGKCK